MDHVTDIQSDGLAKVVSPPSRRVHRTSQPKLSNEFTSWDASIGLCWRLGITQSGRRMDWFCLWQNQPGTCATSCVLLTFHFNPSNLLEALNQAEDLSICSPLVLFDSFSQVIYRQTNINDSRPACTSSHI